MVYINYYSNDLHLQIVKAIGESIINDVLEMTIHFITEMIMVEMKEKDPIKISVIILHVRDDAMLVFRYRCRQYSPILNAEDKSSHIDDFFNYYFDEIHHEYVDGENKLVFRFTMMSDADLQQKYLNALDRKSPRKNEI